MSHYQTHHVPSIAQNAGDADLLLRLGIALSIRKRAGWQLVRFRVQNGVVRLGGIVPTFYDRQLIAALARHVAGVLRVEDELAVGEPSLRQEVTETDVTSGHNHVNAAEVKSSNPFRDLPVVTDSLEDILVQQAATAAAAG
jgi:osmotically-inducible protein OsmY